MTPPNPPNASPKRDIVESINKFLLKSKFPEVLALIAVIGAASGLVSTLFNLYNPSTPALADRISRLTKSLNDSARIITEIEKEVDQRQELLERLQRDAETAKNLAALNSPQANAVVQALRGELDKESNKSFWIGAGQNFVFTILGALLGIFLPGIIHRLPWRNRGTAVPASDIHTPPPGQPGSGV